MDIIIPLGGKGERFINEGYTIPKPLIKIGHKEMIRHVIDRLILDKNDTITILYNEHLDKHNFSGTIRKYYPNIQILPIPFQTRGTVETIDYGLRSQQQLLNNDRKCLLLDCDAFYTCDIIGIAKNYKNGVFVFREEDVSQPAKFSYVSVTDNNIIIDIAEKSRISQIANTGAYLFENRQTLLSFTQKVLLQDFRFHNEFYTSCVIKYMLMENYIFHAIEIPQSFSYISLGTPEQVQSYLSQSHAFLFDLDGTLVDTTDIYVNVWKTLLKPYNVNVDYTFFKNYINGNNDVCTLKMLIPMLTQNDINMLSKHKDQLFLKYLDKIKIIDGAKQFIDKVHDKGFFVGIVTNCNRLVAEQIIAYCKFKIDELVIGNECTNPKPHSDPYQKAKDISGLSNVIIFEDSNIGVLSARGISPKCIVGINCVNNVNIVIDNFNNIEISEIINYHTDNQTTRLETIITDSISERFSDIDHINILPNKLKGGYIADVLRVDLYKKDGTKIECVAKLQNHETFNNLSNMAQQLQLYSREQYFYEVIRDSVRIKVPKYFGTIRNNLKPCGILLEYLPFQLGLDLEKESLDLTLNIIRNIALNHVRFWDKDLVRIFPQLTKNDNQIFCLYVQNYWNSFKQMWKKILTPKQLDLGELVVTNFNNIQKHLCKKPLTLCHGDVKSPNIFFDQYKEPYFIDWQYIVEGKGVQDLVFLMIESFSIQYISKVGNILKDYYYVILQKNGVLDYSIENYNIDFQLSICYFPFFVAIWFGTTPSNELIDINFPFFFIQKLFSFISQYLDPNVFSLLETTVENN